MSQNGNGHQNHQKFMHFGPCYQVKDPGKEGFWVFQFQDEKLLAVRQQGKDIVLVLDTPPAPTEQSRWTAREKRCMSEIIAGKNTVVVDRSRARRQMLARTEDDFKIVMRCFIEMFGYLVSPRELTYQDLCDRNMLPYEPKVTPHGAMPDQPLVQRVRGNGHLTVALSA